MGRKKIQITRIHDERNRQITFSKRKAGLLKKAYELSVLCDVEVAVIMLSSNNKLYQYASSNMNSILIRYTEFKDPDESKTNADILEDITRKEKGGQGRDDENSVEEDTQYLIAAEAAHAAAPYHQLNEEFDQMLQESTSSHAARPPPLITTRVPKAMPVSVPVSTSTQLQVHQRIQQQLGSAGSTGSSSSGTPFTPDTDSSVSSVSAGVIMPPPTGTPTRLQTIRNQTLKLHLPGGGRNYISLGAGASERKSPSASEDGGGRGARGGEGGGGGVPGSTQSRPQLRVVLPGQKGFVYRSAPSSPPPMVGIDNPDPASTSSSLAMTTVASNSVLAAGALNPTSTSMESLTTPVVSLSTPNLLSNISPLLSSLTSEIPLGSAGESSASALVAFPVSIQPTPGTSGASSGSSNIIFQAQNMGQPFLLAPSNYDKQSQLSAPVPFTPPSASALGVTGLSPPLIRDLEQLKLQYDRIYQQISQTLQQHQLHQQHSQKDKPSSEKDSESPLACSTEGPSGDSEGDLDNTDTLLNSTNEDKLPAKRPRLDIPTTLSSS